MNRETVPKPQRLDSTLSKGLRILENLSVSQNSKGVTLLSNELGLTKSNTFRLLQTLVTLGYVVHESDKTYRATLKAWQIGRAVVENMNLRSVAAPLLRLLSEETGETIYLAVRDDLCIVYIDKIESRKPIRTWNPIGGSAPIHCVGTGKAILAAEYDGLRNRVVENLPRFTDNTITSVDALDTDMIETAKRGYAIDRGEFRDRVYSIGSAIVLPNGVPLGALGVSLPDVNLGEGGVEKIGALVLEAARTVSDKLNLY